MAPPRYRRRGWMAGGLRGRVRDELTDGVDVYSDGTT
jgi:hypothetical protein